MNNSGRLQPPVIVQVEGGAVGDITSTGPLEPVERRMGSAALRAERYGGEAGEVRTGGQAGPMGGWGAYGGGEAPYGSGELPMAVRSPLAVGKLPMEVGAITAMAG